MTRLRWALVRGTLSGALSDSDVTMSSAALADLPEVTGGDYAVIVLDPTGTNECVYVTAHTAAATTATIMRGMEEAQGHGPASAHASGVSWIHTPTPLDYGRQPVNQLEALPTELTEVPVVDGIITTPLIVVGPGADHEDTFIALPPAVDVPGQFVTVACADADVGESMQYGLGEAIPDPTAGYLEAGTDGLFGLIFGNGIVDLTTATLGHPYVSKVDVDGSLETGSAINAVFDTDDPMEAGTLVTALLQPAIDAGCTLDGGTLICSSPTTGASSEVIFDATMESFLGIDFAVDVPTTPGYEGTIRGIDDTASTAGAAAHYPADWDIPAAPAPVGSGDLAKYHRGCTVVAVPADMNGGVAKWSAVRYPYRQVDIPVISNVTDVSNLKNITTKLVTVGANRAGGSLPDGAYLFGLTMASSVGDMDWEAMDDVAAAILADAAVVAALAAKTPVVPAVTALTPTTGSVNIDLDAWDDTLATLALSGNITLTTSNRGAGKSFSIKILCDATPRTFTFPSWVPVGAALPAGIAAGKTGILSGTCYGSADTDIVVGWAVQP